MAPVELNRTPASLCFDQDTARGPTLSPKTSPCLEGPHVGGVEHLKCRHFLPQVQGTSSDSWESDGRTRNDFTLLAAHTRVFECTRRDLHVKLTFHVCASSAVILSAGQQLRLEMTSRNYWEYSDSITTLIKIVVWSHKAFFFVLFDMCSQRHLADIATNTHTHTLSLSLSFFSLLLLAGLIL